MKTRVRDFFQNEMVKFRFFFSKKNTNSLQNQKIKVPKMTSFWMTWLGSSTLTKRRHFIFCHICLFLPRMKLAKFETRFNLSEARKLIKMKVNIFKYQLFFFRIYLQKSKKFKI